MNIAARRDVYGLYPYMRYMGGGLTRSQAVRIWPAGPGGSDTAGGKC